MRITRPLVTMPNMAPPIRPPKAQPLPERKRRLRNEPLKIPPSLAGRGRLCTAPPLRDNSSVPPGRARRIRPTAHLCVHYRTTSENSISWHFGEYRLEVDLEGDRPDNPGRLSCP